MRTFKASLRAACLLFALLLFSSALLAAAVPVSLPARTYIITAEVADSGGKPVPNALVLVSLSNASAPANASQARVLEALTSLTGRARILVSVGTNQSTPSASLNVYLPYWSSAPTDLSLPDRPVDVFDRNFTLPFALNTYRIRLNDQIGNPVPLAEVQFMQPYPLYGKTDANGLVQVRLPPDRPVNGYIQFQGTGQLFSFGSLPLSSSAIEKDFGMPFAGRVQSWNDSFDWSPQLLDAMGRPLVLQPVDIRSGSQNWSYLSDREGRLFLRELPFENLTLETTSYNFTYRFPLNISRAGPRLQMPLLIHISDPAKDVLGDSCYRIRMNVTDQRQSPNLQVQARPINGSGTLPFTLDQAVPLSNRSGVQFTRILCVDVDTTFDIVAQNPFEQVDLQIQLKTTDNFVPPATSVYAQAPPAGLFDKTAAKSDTGRIEIILLLVYVFFGLIAIFFAVRFKHLLLYYGQSILRFTYTFYKSRKSGPSPGGEGAGPKGGPPARKPPSVFGKRNSP